MFEIYKMSDDEKIEEIPILRRRKKVAKKPEPVILEEVKDVNDYGVSRDLYPHQKRSVQRMESLERNDSFTYRYEQHIELDEGDVINSPEIKINTKFGILSDKVGTGKTLTVISLISREVNSPNYNKNVEDKRFEHTYSNNDNNNNIFSYSITTTRVCTYYPVNIIAVNNSVVQQWDKELSYSNLQYKIIYKVANMNSIKDWFAKMDVIVVSKTLYSDFIDLLRREIPYTNRIGVRRLIFDEYNRRGRFQIGDLVADFYWLISATVPVMWNFTSNEVRLNMMNTLLSISSFNNVNSYTWDHLIIRNTEEELRLSYSICNIRNIEYISRSEYRSILNNNNMNLPNEVRRMLIADDVAGVIAHFGGNVSSDTSIIDLIINKEEKEIHKIRASITYYETLQNEERKKEQEQKLKEALDKLQNIKSKIERDMDEDCSVCMDSLNEVTLMYCCNSIICGKCVSTIMKGNNKCPFCRNLIDPSKLIIKTNKKNSASSSRVEQRLTKLDYIYQIINNKSNGKFIIFSEYWNTFDNIKNLLNKYNIKWCEVKGNTDVRKKNIERFKTGETKVIFLNGRFDGSGINLPETTDIILYHKTSTPEIETQVLGRALRLGRSTGDLTVHRLLYENENSIENNVQANYALHENDGISEESSINNEDTLRQIEEDRQLAMELARQL